MQIRQLVPAEPGWKAVFKEPDGGESQSRILAWAVTDDGAAATRRDRPGRRDRRPRLLPRASSARPTPRRPPEAAFSRYRYVAPAPLVVPPPAPAPEPDDTAERLAKGLLKRKR